MGTEVQILGTRARVLKPTYGVLVHGVRTEKENIDPSNQSEATEKIRTENATLHPGANITYVEWLTKSGAKKPASSLVVEFTTKAQATRAIREGLVLSPCHHECGQVLQAEQLAY
jgi:ribosomal protein L24